MFNGVRNSFRRATHLYNAATDKWTLVTSSSVDRLGPGLVNVNGRLFALGAIDSPTNVVEEFLLENNTWQVPSFSFHLAIPASSLA